MRPIIVLFILIAFFGGCAAEMDYTYCDRSRTCVSYTYSDQYLGRAWLVPEQLELIAVAMHEDIAGPNAIPASGNLKICLLNRTASPVDVKFKDVRGGSTRNHTDRVTENKRSIGFGTSDVHIDPLQKALWLPGRLAINNYGTGIDLNVDADVNGLTRIVQIYIPRLTVEQLKPLHRPLDPCNV